MRGLVEAAPLVLLQPVALFAAAPAEATPISSLVTRLSGGDATVIAEKKSKRKIAFLAPPSSLLDKAHKYARYAWHLYTQSSINASEAENYCGIFA